MDDSDLPEVRVRQPAFSDLTRRAGLAELEVLKDALDLDMEEVRNAVHGGPVSPGFVASVLMMFPDHRFRDLFQLNIHAIGSAQPAPTSPADVANSALT